MNRSPEASRLRRPPVLRNGDRIGVFLPSSPIREPFRTRGLDALREMGYVPVEVPDILSHGGFVAKSPAVVIREMETFFDDDRIQALWAARGGYGANLLCTALNRLNIQSPKIVIGSSDVSALLWNLMDRHEMVVFFGPMAYASLASGRVDHSQLQGLLSGVSPCPEFSGDVWIPGRATGRLTGGCLSTLVSLIGTPFFPVIRDRILLLEDVNERPYRLHRMFWQLMESGLMQGVRGVVLGEFPECFSHPGEEEHLATQLTLLLRPLGIPVIAGLPLGHSAVTRTVPMGVKAEIIASGEHPVLKILEPGTRDPGEKR